MCNYTRIQHIIVNVKAEPFTNIHIHKHHKASLFVNARTPGASPRAGYAHPTSARGCSQQRCKSGEFFLQGRSQSGLELDLLVCKIWRTRRICCSRLVLKSRNTFSFRGRLLPLNPSAPKLSLWARPLRSRWVHPTCFTEDPAPHHHSMDYYSFHCQKFYSSQAHMGPEITTVCICVRVCMCVDTKVCVRVWPGVQCMRSHLQAGSRSQRLTQRTVHSVRRHLRTATSPNTQHHRSSWEMWHYFAELLINKTIKGDNGYGIETEWPKTRPGSKPKTRPGHGKITTQVKTCKHANGQEVLFE